MHVVIRFAASIGLVALVSACAAPEPTVAPTRPAVERVKPTPPRVTPTAIPSGGLGMFRDEWEAAQGQPLRARGPVISYRGGNISVAFANNIVWYIERQWPGSDMPGRDVARATSKEFLPGDALLVGSYQIRGSRRYDQYSSESLATRFRLAAESAEPVDPWKGAAPGSLIVIYRDLGDRVSTIVIATGLNPNQTSPS